MSLLFSCCGGLQFHLWSCPSRWKADPIPITPPPPLPPPPLVPADTLRTGWAVVELYPSDRSGEDYQRVVVTRDTRDAAERVMRVLFETSLGDEVFRLKEVPR
jgi:hypothetical protein